MRASEEATNTSAEGHSSVSTKNECSLSLMLAAPPVDGAGGESVREQVAWAWQSVHAENPGTSSLMTGQT